MCKVLEAKLNRHERPLMERSLEAKSVFVISALLTNIQTDHWMEVDIRVRHTSSNRLHQPPNEQGVSSPSSCPEHPLKDSCVCNCLTQKHPSKKLSVHSDQLFPLKWKEEPFYTSDSTSLKSGPRSETVDRIILVSP